MQGAENPTGYATRFAPPVSRATPFHEPLCQNLCRVNSRPRRLSAARPASRPPARSERAAPHPGVRREADQRTAPARERVEPAQLLGGEDESPLARLREQLARLLARQLPERREPNPALRRALGRPREHPAQK